MARLLPVCLLASLLSATLDGQRSNQVAPVAQDVDGAHLFRTYCASCHGMSARGDGPLADQLRKAPPDLTTFTQRNGGVFPSERVRQIIDGRGVAAHGNREMPVWGDAFRTGQSGMSRDAVQTRIDALVRYLESIQQRAAE